MVCQRRHPRRRRRILRNSHATLAGADGRKGPEHLPVTRTRKHTRVHGYSVGATGGFPTPATGSVHANTGGLLRVVGLRERELVGKEDVLGVITDHLNKGVPVGGHRASVATEGRALPRRRLLKSLVQAFELRGIGFALNSGVACQGAIDESRRRAA